MWAYVLAGVGVLVVLGITGWLGGWGASVEVGSSSNGPTAIVTRGPLVVSVTESGEIEADRRKVISNELQWSVVIKSLVGEGATVQEGDEIIVFECKELMDAITKQRLTVTDANNLYTQSHQNAVLKRKEMANTIRKAEQAVQEAQEDLRRYEEAAGPTDVADARSAIFVAKQDLALAEDQLNFKLKVNRDKELNSPFSENDIEAEKLKVERLKLAYKKATTALDMLLKYDHPRQLRQLKMAVDDAELALERAKLEAQGEILMAEANEMAKQAALKMQTDQLNEWEEEAKKLVVKAEKEGLVVYDTGGDWRRPTNVVVEVGAKISPRQQLMIIPDMTTLQIKTKVYESIIDQVKRGQPAYVRFDARPDAILPGRIDSVGVLPSSQHRWLNPGVKVFEVIVKLDEEFGDLKPGMTAQVEIELARLKDVLSVPVAAVFTEQEKTYCYRVDGGQLSRVEVRVGRMNDTRVEIISGLEAGDEVALSPPPTVEAGKERPAEEAPLVPPAEQPLDRVEPTDRRGEAASRPAGPDRPDRPRGSGPGRDRPGGAGRQPRPGRRGARP